MDRQALIQEFRDLAAMHEGERKKSFDRNDMIGHAYFAGRRDQCYSAAGLIADDLNATIERLDSHKHAGDTLVGFAGR